MKSQLRQIIPIGSKIGLTKDLQRLISLNIYQTVSNVSSQERVSCISFSTNIGNVMFSI